MMCSSSGSHYSQRHRVMVHLYWHRNFQQDFNTISRKMRAKTLGLDFSDRMKNFFSKWIWSGVKTSVFSSPTWKKYHACLPRKRETLVHTVTSASKGRDDSLREMLGVYWWNPSKHYSGGTTVHGFSECDSRNLEVGWRLSSWSLSSAYLENALPLGMAFRKAGQEKDIKDSGSSIKIHGCGAAPTDDISVTTPMPKARGPL